MIRKLKYQFIGVMVALFGCAMLIIVASLYYSVHHEMTERIELTLYDTLNEKQVFISELGKTEKQKPQMNAFKIDENGIISSQTIQSIDIDFLHELLQKAANTSGQVNVKNQYFAYLKANNEIAFVAIDDDLKRMSHLLLNWIIVFSLALLLVFILSTILTNWLLKPINENWRKQKQFISDASHELKTPLAIILANLSILKQEPNALINTKMKWLNYSEEEAKRMQELIEQLLFLAKSEQKNTLKKVSINLSDLILQTTLPLEAIAFEKQQTLSLTIAENVYIYGNEMYLKQLMVILIDNAIKYAPIKTDIKINLTKTAQFSIQNQSDLLTNEQQKRLFDRFYRIDQARQRNSQTHGYGLGLAIAQEIALMHQAQIKVESNLQVGIRFSIAFQNLK